MQVREECMTQVHQREKQARQILDKQCDPQHKCETMPFAIANALAPLAASHVLDTASGAMAVPLAASLVLDAASVLGH
jgi:hypothetical protein